MLTFVKTGWENLDNPLYSPDLAPSDFHLFPKMKEFLGGKQMATHEEMRETVMDWLNGLTSDFYDYHACAMYEQMSESQWGICRKINLCCKR
jgi:histone-lysine N-methyltransferase SETMAR